MLKRRGKKGENQEKKKLQIFFLFTHFYAGRKNFINKNCLFYAKFFAFEVKSYSPFFWVASSLSILCCNMPILVQLQKITNLIWLYWLTFKNHIKPCAYLDLNHGGSLNNGGFKIHTLGHATRRRSSCRSTRYDHIDAIIRPTVSNSRKTSCASCTTIFCIKKIQLE